MALGQPLARFKRAQFGSSSERYEGQLLQLELLVEDLEATQAQVRPAPIVEALEPNPTIALDQPVVAPGSK
ncbi:MAG: hypothetical protein ABIP64_06620 [Burkholderiales bacterium]